jgi:hypothetical protein
MIYLINSLPNSLMPKEGQELLVKGISIGEVIDLLTEENPYLSYDDNVIPHSLKKNVISHVGHLSTALLYGEVMGREIGAHSYGGLTPIKVEVSREMVVPIPGDVLVCGLFTSNRRLGEGELYAEEEVLAMQIKWVMVQY